MFEKIFIEESLKEHPQALKILERLGNPETTYIENYNQIFGKVKKPYLQKRESLNLFIAQKKGALVKEAPDAYGLAGDPHYYFIHAYNCLYECDYCYLQGYFHSPDMVFFVNHDEILEEIHKKVQEAPSDATTWFHAGEFSDSLALSHLTGELPQYFDYFRKHPQTRLELRTKSVNTRALEALEPAKNIIISFSLAPEEQVKNHDLKTPSLKLRLKAIKKLASLGHPIGIHLDPIIYRDNIQDQYQDLLKDLVENLPAQQLQYISLGVVRFTKDVFHQVKKNYPNSPSLSAEFIKGADNKVRYTRPMRHWLLQTIKQLCLDANIEEEKIYLCMED